MSRPPVAPPYRSTVTRSSWRSIIASAVLVIAVPLTLWAVSHPLAGTVVVAAVVGTVAGTRRAARLVRCFYDCGGFALVVGDRVRVTVSQPGDVDDRC